MANTVNQAKLRKTAFALQTLKGTPANVTTPSLFDVLPATEFDMPLDRGTAIISRANTMDGFAGEMCGVPGSFGYSPSLTVEVHSQHDGAEPSTPVPFPYWVKLLMASGHEALYESATVDDWAVTLSPSVRNIRDLTDQALTPVHGTTYGPYLGTVEHFRYADPETRTNCYRYEAVDTVFGATFNFTPGERLTIAFAGKGKLSDSNRDPAKEMPAAWFPLGAADTDLPDGVGCSPWVVKGITVEIEGEEPVSLSSFEFNTNAQLDDVVDPRSENGFGTSNVIWEEAPTVSFTIAEEAWNSAPGSVTNVLNRFRLGASVKIEVEMDGPDAETFLEFDFERVQFTGVSPGTVEGYASWDIEGKIVRDPSDPKMYDIKYSYEG